MIPVQRPLSMKKALIILILALAAIWWMALPALVGVYLRGWVPDWAAETVPRAQSTFSPGWFLSNLELHAPEGAVQLQVRHFPALKPAWLSLSGQVRLPYMTETLQASGRIGLTGQTDLMLTSSSLNLQTAPTVQAAETRMQLTQQPGIQTLLSVASQALLIQDRLNNHLALEQARINLAWSTPEPGLAELGISVGLLQSTENLMQLKLTAAPIDIEALGELINGLAQLRSARPDSLDRQLALLTVGGAWQQMSAAGLEITLHELSLSGDTRLSGHWQTTTGLPEIRGQGDVDTILDWLVPAIGLSRRTDPISAEREARAWLATLVDYQWLTIAGRRFEINNPKH
jgi:hypothetical protein